MDSKQRMQEKLGNNFWILEISERVVLNLGDRLDEAREAFAIPEVRALVLATYSALAAVSKEDIPSQGRLPVQAKALALALFFKDYLAERAKR
jgi:hypothetical protein